MSIAVMRGKTSKGEGQLDTKQQDRQPLSRQENPFANGAMTMPNGVKISKTHDAAPAGEGAYAVKANGSHLAQSAANHDTPQNKVRTTVPAHVCHVLPPTDNPFGAVRVCLYVVHIW